MLLTPDMARPVCVGRPAASAKVCQEAIEVQAQTQLVTKEALRKGTQNGGQTMVQRIGYALTKQHHVYI